MAGVAAVVMLLQPGGVGLVMGELEEEEDWISHRY